MTHHKNISSGSAAVALLVASGCVTTGPINPNDSTPPTVELKFQNSNGQYVTASQTTMSASETLKIMGVFSDPEGLYSVALSASGTATSCTIDGTVIPGSFSIQTLPAPVQDTYSSSAKLLTKVPLFIDLKGPFKCKILGTVNGKSEGVPFGADIKVTGSAQNWSSKAQAKTGTATLTVKLP